MLGIVALDHKYYPKQPGSQKAQQHERSKKKVWVSYLIEKDRAGLNGLKTPNLASGPG